MVEVETLDGTASRDSTDETEDEIWWEAIAKRAE